MTLLIVVFARSVTGQAQTARISLMSMARDAVIHALIAMPASVRLEVRMTILNVQQAINATAHLQAAFLHATMALLVIAYSMGVIGANDGGFL